MTNANYIAPPEFKVGRYIYKPLVEVEVAGNFKQQCTISTVVGEREEKEKKEGRSKQKEKPIASSSLEGV